MTDTEKILEKLIGFPTVSRDSNIDLIGYIQSYLSDFGIESHLTHNHEKTKANLYAVFGPGAEGGVMLSGHTDVVPVEGQEWTKNPFAMTVENDRLYGRGAADMKGFIASVLAMVPAAFARNLKHPVHLAFSYDEEIGCVGVQRMIDMLKSTPNRPDFCIIGEPTSLNVAIAHKGKIGALCRCHGVEAHSALAARGLNAIYLAAEMINAIRELQDEIKKDYQHDNDFAVPHTTLHVGTINGGTALNIIPNHCEFKFEIRNLRADDPMEIMEKIRSRARLVKNSYKEKFPAADVEIEIFNEYPALNTAPGDEVVRCVGSLVGAEKPIKIDFGTEGGLFQKRLGVPAVVCGPGSMEQGHRPDEFIRRSELKRCDRFLSGLLDRISD